ncbi:hypothetical protein [Saccharopolyspora mangrovi]|uniref:Uncharacterized protein n=1 Tax=Saccharopolyspora mangrovi TaxID=3082379 RepID=A0ABU6A8Q2_9PSEU|nr:hypothetical protein [Saccharopolyspora sp. S2-29]MEB3367879.1 hypothetical protein [Saccharopolyspora sp. S2-29]
MIKRLLAKLSGTAEVPADFAGSLEEHEHVLSAAPGEGGPVVATHLGLWLPEGRRVGWHLISKATWGSGVLTVTEAEEARRIDGAVILRDLQPRRLALTGETRLPDVVHERVNRSIRTRHHRELPGGGAWFVQRKVPGRNGIELQIRPDPGTDEAALDRLAGALVQRLRESRDLPA